MRLLFVVLLTAVVCGCGNGSAVMVPPSSAGHAILGEAAITVAIPASGGITGTMTFPAIRGASAIEISASTSAPAGVSLQGGDRHPRSVGTLAIYDYVAIVAQSTIVLPSLPAFSLTLPASIATAGKSFFYGVSEPHVTSGMPTHFDARGPATLSAQTLTFPAADGPLTLTAGEAYTFVVYATYAAPPGPIGPRIYVEDGAIGAIAIFNADGSRSSPARIVVANPSGVETLEGLRIDNAGKIYVVKSDGTSQTLVTFNGDGSPATPSITGFPNIVGLAVDSAGKIYAAASKYSTGRSSVTTYDRNGKPTTPTIAGGLDDVFLGVAVDPHGKIYVLDQAGFPNQTILTYTPDGVRTTPTIALPASLSDPTDIAIDNDGKIYVANFQGPGCCGEASVDLATFTPAGVATTPTISGANDNCTGVAVDPSGKIYLACGNGNVRTYQPDGTPTVPVISVGLYTSHYIGVH